MSIYIACTLFSLIILLYWIISETFTILFRLTGLPEEQARFQVVSLLTGCGFTTQESEIFLSSRTRRRMARFTMLFGYVFNITIVSALINVFMSLKRQGQVHDYYLDILVPLAEIALLIVVMRVPAVRRRGDALLEKLAHRVLHTDSVNSALLLGYIGEDTIAQVTLSVVPEELRDVPLSDSGLRSGHGISVLLVEHKGEKARIASGDTVFLPGDTLTLFGDYGEIRKIFDARERFTDP